MQCVFLVLLVVTLSASKGRLPAIRGAHGARSVLLMLWAGGTWQSCGGQVGDVEFVSIALLGRHRGW